MSGWIKPNDRVAHADAKRRWQSASIARIAPNQGFVMGIGRKPVLGGRDVVKVAIVQKASRFLDKEGSLARAETYIVEAAAGGAELIVFPEVWLAGYPYWT